MPDSRWTTIARWDPADLAAATVEVHQALQVVAAAGQTFARPRGDDAHRAAVWAPELQAFVGEDFSPGYPFRVALRVADLTLLLLERSGSTLGSLGLSGRTLDDGYAWLGEAAKSYMGGGHAPVRPPDFAIPAHPVARGARFRRGRSREREAVAALFGAAAEVLEAFVRARRDADPVRCWPHHFDVGTSMTVREGSDGAPARTVGLGMAPMGGGYDAWYWYVNTWPAVERGALAGFDGPGHAHHAGWSGVVLEGRDVIREGPAARSVVEDFLGRAVPAATNALTGT